MVCCAAWGCSNRSEKGVKMYGFPSDTKRRKKWLAQVSRRNFTITNDYNNKKLCQEHFHADQFVKTRKGKTRLRADAIPTIFVHRRVVKKRAPIPQCTSLLVNLKHIAVEHSYSVKGSTAYLSNSSTDASSPTNPAASLLLHPATPSAPTVLQLPLDAVNPKLTELHHNAERLPKTEENEWIAVIHGDTWNPGSELWISSCHSMSRKKRDDPLHPDFVPSLFSFTSTTDQTWAVNNLERRVQSQEVPEKKHASACKELAATALLNLHQSPASQAEVQVADVQSPEVQTEEKRSDIISLHEQVESLSTECQSLRDKVHKLESELKFCPLDASLFDDDKMKYFTGLPNLQTFMLLYSDVSSIPPATAEQSLKPTWELLLTLMKLRLNLSEEFLGHLFGINQSTVSRIFLHWIHVMANQLQPLILWPKREDLRHSLPICLQTFFKNCVSIIDCFEVFIECPSDLKAQDQTWSIYKQHNTVKFLVSITPQGTISFVSKAWGGRFTDKHLTKYSGFLDQLLPGDLVLAERDFTMEDSIGLFCAELVTPPSMQGKKRLSRRDIKSAGEISLVRNHVKRVIGVLRQKYTILGSTLPVNLLRVEQNGKVEDSLIDKIVLTCCALCNLSQTIVPSD